MTIVRRLASDTRAVTAVEFALVAPVLALLLVGAMDIGHTLYMRSIVQGAVQKSARDSGLETGTDAQIRAAIDAKVSAQVRDIHNGATITFNRQYFRSFTQAVDVREPFTDATSGPFMNNRCDNGEPYVDENNNGRWDTAGREGQGDAKDSVLYTVTVSYPRMFPIFNFVGVPNTTVVKATTIMNNQPYGDQNIDAVQPVRNCT